METHYHFRKYESSAILTYFKQWVTIFVLITIFTTSGWSDGGLNDSCNGEQISELHSISATTSRTESGTLYDGPGTDDDDDYYYFSPGIEGTLTITNYVSNQNTNLYLSTVSCGSDKVLNNATSYSTLTPININSSDTVYIRVERKRNNATTTYSIPITFNAAPQVPPIMGDVPNQTAVTGTSYSLSISGYVTLTNGDPIISYTLTGTPPTGLSFNTTTGVLSGTPTVDGTYNLSVIATDNDGSSNSDAFTINVYSPPIMGNVPDQTAINGTSYSLSISTYVTLTNGDPIISYTLTGTLPTGLSFNTTTGVLSGTPAADGTYNLSVIATDKDGNSNSDAFTLVVSSIQTPPIMGDVPNQTLTNGTSYSLSISTYVTLTNGDPIISYTLTGTPPTGLSFNTTTGVLSGTPTVDGTYNLSVVATDNDGDSNSDSFTLTVSSVLDFTCANPKTFIPVYGDSAYSKLVLIGNTSLCKNNGSGVCSDPGTSTNNDINMMYNDYDDVIGTSDNSATTLNSSAALLDIPAGKRVLWAGLFWQGYMVNWTSTQKDAGRSIKYKHADDSSYESTTSAAMNWVYFDSSRFYYQSFVDITAYVNSYGPGYYWVGDIATTQGQPVGGSFGAWSIAVVYEDNDEEFRNTTVFHGYQAFAGTTDINNAISYASSHGCSTSNTGVGTNISSTLTGFLTPKEGSVNSSLIVFAGEGDIGISGDSGSITDKTGTEHPLTNTLNPPTNIMNATISKDGATVTTGLPYYSANTLGADIDTYDMSGIFGNEQSTTNIKFVSSGDGYMPGMYALESQIYIPEFCYDYAYKQQGRYFTESNDGTQTPKISGSVISNEPIEVSVFIRNLVDSDIAVTDMYVDVSDINITQARYIANTTKLARIGNLTPTNLVDGTDVTVGTTADGDYINDITIGSIDSNEHFYTYYSINPLSNSIDMPLSVQARYNITVAGDTIPYTLKLSEQIPLCSTSNFTYEPVNGRFNVVHNNYYDYDIGGSNRYYNLPTQVTSREGNFKVIAMDPNNLDNLQAQSTSVAVELIDVSAFHDTYASCQEEDSSISEKVQVFFENNATSVLFDKTALQNAIDNAVTNLTSTSEFYSTARENVAFRISYGLTNDGNNSLVQHEYDAADDEYKILNFTQLVQDVGTCVQRVTYNTTPIQTTENVSVACGNAGTFISKKHYYACLQCLYGINTRFECSRDNFSIRPEAFMIKIDDQSQTSPTSQLRIADDVSGVVTTPSTAVSHLATGYNYNIEINATNHLNNNASPGYTKVFGDYATDVLEYLWSPTVTTTGCNETNSTTHNFKIVNGNIDLNSSMTRLGEYILHMDDTTWTSVDSTPVFMIHHTGSFFLPSTTPDCMLNTSSTQPVNSSILNGCNISSSHNSSGSSLKYGNYNVEFHPYKFNMGGIWSSYGENNSTDFTGAPFIYMSDVSQDEEMSFHLNGNIAAAGYNNEPLSNFVNNCYAEPVDLGLKKSAISGAIDFVYRFHNTDIPANDQNGTMNGTTGTITLDTDDFNRSNNGTVNTSLNLNFDRNVTNFVNPEEVTFNSYDANCSTPANCSMNADLTIKTAQGVVDLNQTIKHYYGRTHASRQRYVGDTATPPTNIYYEVYCFGTLGGNTCDKTLLQNGINSRRTDDIRWFINDEHNVTNDGSVGVVSQRSGTEVTVIAPTDYTANPATVTIKYDSTKGYPYKTTMQNNASGWLIYNKDDPTATRNQFSIEFEDGGAAWSGEHNTSTTTKDVGAVRTNRRSLW